MHSMTWSCIFGVFDGFRLRTKALEPTSFVIVGLFKNSCIALSSLLKSQPWQHMQRGALGTGIERLFDLASAYRNRSPFACRYAWKELAMMPGSAASCCCLSRTLPRLLWPGSWTRSATVTGAGRNRDSCSWMPKAPAEIHLKLHMLRTSCCLSRVSLRQLQLGITAAGRSMQ